MRNNISVVNKEKCYGCYACYNKCSQNAIDMVEDTEGFVYPEVNEKRCVDCQICLKVCPSIRIPGVNTKKETYACYAKNEEEHKSSSSGGFFAVLAEAILEEKGNVFGAVFNEKIEVEHVKIQDIKDMYKVKGTKYVQSYIGKTYIEVKRALEKGEEVLFSGTPCQVAGLKNFLDKKYDNLVCLDLICHGVPSPGVWRRYLEEKFGKDNVKTMQFRNKEKGISDVTLEYRLKNDTIIFESYLESPYIKGFINNYYTRQSCFNCGFKGFDRCSDITIGDFWSVREFYPQMENKYGVSAIIVHSEKGSIWLEKIRNRLIICKAKPEELAVWNDSLLKSAKRTPARLEFYQKWENDDIEKLVLELSEDESCRRNRQFIKQKIVTKIFEKIKRWLK